MKTTKSLFLFGAGLLLALCRWSTTAATLSPQPESLFLSPPPRQILLADVPLDSARSRPVQLNPALLAKMRGPGPHQVSVETFGGVRLTVTLNERQDFGPDRFAWTGVVDGYSPSTMTVVVCEDVVTMEMRTLAQGHSRLRLKRDGSYWLDEVDPSASGGCGNDSGGVGNAPHADATVPPGVPPLLAAPPSLMSVGTGPLYIDVLALYSKTARTQAGSSSAIRASILKSVALANSAHANSDTHFRFRLLDMVELNYFDSGSISNDLEHLIDPSDGWIDEAHILRDQYRADLVHLFVDSMGVPGDAEAVGRAETGGEFGVTKWDSSGFVFVHGTGHNLGCRHQPEKGGDGYNHAWQARHDWYDPTFGAFWGTSKAETVMWASTSSTMVPRFSDPGATMRFSTPFTDEVMLPLGNEQIANNTRYIREHGLEKIPLRGAWLHVDGRSPSGGEATLLSPVRSLSLAFNVWYDRTLSDSTQQALVTVVPGQYFEAVRIASKSVIRRSGSEGVVHIGTP